MNQRVQGFAFTILSALIFGFTPILVRMAYDGGANGITMTFLRGLIALPLLAFLTLKHGEPLLPASGEVRKVLILALGGSALTTLLLYLSYSYIPVGMATSLHFVYPLLVNLSCRLIYREKLGQIKRAALMVGTAGILLFADFSSSGGLVGIVLALLSGGAYAFYIVYMAVSGLKRMYYFRLAFYLGLGSAVVSGAFGLATGRLNLRLTPTAWLIAAAVSLLTAAGATALFQLGIRLAGSSNAALLSTFEPVTSVALGALLLGETMSPAKWAGCVCILSSVLLITLAETVPPRSGVRPR